jgi:response regulator RpfG family c-di-GMP phosphodiesterase
MAFFSDITLKSQLQMKVNSAEDLASVELSEEEREQVVNHAKDAAAIVKDYPPGTDYLQQNILHHHGSLTGEGFPEQPSNDIDPIAKIFIIADAFVKTLLNPHAPKNKKEILVILYMQFSDEGYQKIIKVLEQKMD